MENGDMGNGFYCSFPSVIDPLQIHHGKCIGSIYKMAPFDLQGGSDKWYSYKFKEELAQRLLARLGEYAPNMTPENISSMYVSTPVDIQNKFPDMVKGSIKQGEYLPLQMPEVEASVPAHETDDGVLLLVKKTPVIGYHCDPNNRGHLTVLKINLRHGYIEPYLFWCNYVLEIHLSLSCHNNVIGVDTFRKHIHP